MTSRALAVAALFLLAGCGGGGGGVSPSSGPGPNHPVLQQATLKISFPVNVGATSSSKARSPQYVSPNSHSIKITINSIDGGNTTIPSWVTPNPDVVALTTTGGSPNCTVSGGTETCTIDNVPAPPGTTNYTFGVYASTDGSGTALATATVNENVVQGILNNFTVTLSGVATTLVTQNITAFTANSPATDTDIVAVEDPSGARIVGTAPFNGGATVTVTDNDTSGQTSLQAGTGGGSATTCSSATVCTLSHGADTVNLVYTGRAVSGTGQPPVDSFTVTASSSGLTTATGNSSITDNPITDSVTTLDDTAHGGQAGDPNYNQPTLFFASTGNSQGFTAAELGYSNSPYNGTFSTSFDSASCGSGASAVATISPASGTSFTVTSQNPGICKLTVSDTVGQSVIIWVSVTTSNFTVNSHNRHV